MARVLLVLLEVAQGRGVLARPAAALDHAVRRVEVGLLARVELAGDQLGLLLGDLGQAGRGLHAGPQRDQPGGDRHDLAAPVAGRLVAGQRPGPADVALAGAGGVRRQRRVDPVGAHAGTSATSSAVGVVSGDQPAAGPDRRQHVLDGRGAEHPHGAVGRLLDRLEQGVAGLLGEPVGVLDDQDLPAPADRGERGAADQVADLVDADRELLGADHRDVGVAAGEHGVALVAARRSPPARSHCSAAAKATAALERPDPGGPVNRNAWLMPWPAAAACSASMACRWPTRSSQTVARSLHGRHRAALACASSGVDPLADLLRRSRRRSARASSTR